MGKVLLFENNRVRIQIRSGSGKATYSLMFFARKTEKLVIERTKHQNSLTLFEEEEKSCLAFHVKIHFYFKNSKSSFLLQTNKIIMCF